MPLLERMMSVTSLGTGTPTLEMESRSVSRSGGFGIGIRDSIAHPEEETAPIIKTGYLRKLKTMKRKWFVLLGASSCQTARLTYYDNEKNWRSRGLPKRDIVLENVFNISRKRDTRDSVNKPVIGIYTLQDCVSILFENEKEMTDWLETLLSQQQHKKSSKINYQYLWQVSIKAFKPDSRNGFQLPNLIGPHRLCVTNAHVKFFPMGVNSSLDIPHGCIRSCAHSDRVFRLVTGRKSPCGPGSIVIICDAKDVTQHLHETVLNAMKSTRSSEQDGHKNPQRSWSRATSDSESMPKEASRMTSPCDIGKRVRSVSDCEGSGSAPTHSYSLATKSGSIISKAGSIISGTSIESYGSLLGTTSYASTLDSSGMDIPLDRARVERSRNHSGMITDGEGSDEWKWPGLVSPLLPSYTNIAVSLISPIQQKKLAEILPLEDNLLNQSEYIDCDFNQKDSAVHSDYISMLECSPKNVFTRSPVGSAKIESKEEFLSVMQTDNYMSMASEGRPSRGNPAVLNDQSDYLAMNRDADNTILNDPDQSDYMAMDRDENQKTEDVGHDEVFPLLTGTGPAWSCLPTFLSARKPTNSLSADEESVFSGLSPGDPSPQVEEADEYLPMNMLSVSQTSKSPSSSTLVPMLQTSTLVPMLQTRKKSSTSQDALFPLRKSPERIRCSMTKLDCSFKPSISRVPDSCPCSPLKEPVTSERRKEMAQPDDIYMPVYYPRHTHTSTSSLISTRVSSPSSPRSGVPPTESKYSSFHLEKVVSRLRNDDEEPKFTKTLPARVSSSNSSESNAKKSLTGKNSTNTLPTRAFLTNQTVLENDGKPEVRTIPRNKSKSRRQHHGEDVRGRKHSGDELGSARTSWAPFGASPPGPLQSNSVVSRLQGLLRNHTGSIPVLIHSKCKSENK